MAAAGSSGPRSLSRWTLAAAALAGSMAIAAMILGREGNPKYVFVGFAIMVFVVLLPLVGNMRTFSLYCILMLAPLGLRLALMPIPHMGGAGALYIEPVDPFVFLLAFYQLRERFKGYRTVYKFPFALWFWVALIVMGVGTVIFATLRTLAILEIVRMLKLLLLALVVINEVVTRRQFHGAVAALLLGVIIQGSVALTQNFMGRQLGLQFLGESSDEDVKLLGKTTIEGGEFVYRAGGLIGHANLLAAYLALFMPVAIALLLTSASRLLKTLSLLALLVGTPALVLTLSRAGWIDFVAAFVIVVVLGAWHSTSRRGYMFARVAVVVCVLIAGAAMSPMILKRINQAEPTSVEYRLKWIRTARLMIEDNAIFGVGLNSYVFNQLPYGELRTPLEMTQFYGEMWPVVHNAWLIVWSEQGTVGMAIWITFHILVIITALKNLRIRDPVLHAVGVGLLGGFIAIMIDGMASFFVRQEGTARMFWIATSLIFALEYWRRANDEERPALAPQSSEGTALPALADGLPDGRWLPSRPSLLR